MNILDKIIEHKYKEVEENKSLFPVKLLEKSMYFDSKPVSLKKYLTRQDKTGIIAEFKRKSPSKGIINEFASIERVSIGYMRAGASALSILTDKTFFGGSNSELTAARKYNFCPILRKDFVIDEYQIIEAKSIGADAILLIAACLTKTKTKKLAEFASSLGLEVLFEIHTKEELNQINNFIDIIGVNNRDLRTFKTNINKSLEIGEHIGTDFVKISESGIDNPKDIVLLKQNGFQGFLIGERFMKTGRPEKACLNFIKQINKMSNNQ